MDLPEADLTQIAVDLARAAAKEQARCEAMVLECFEFLANPDAARGACAHALAKAPRQLTAQEKHHAFIEALLKQHPEGG